MSGSAPDGPPARVWQAWRDEDSVTFTTRERVGELRRSGLLSAAARLVHEFAAATGERAMTRHHELMGWEPYRPAGRPAPCPRGCGAEYYPEGYGECPNCGPIG